MSAPVRWAGRSPTITQERYEAMLEIKRERAIARQRVAEAQAALNEARRMRDLIPTDAQLAREAGVTEQCVSNAIRNKIKRHEHAMSGAHA